MMIGQLSLLAATGLLSRSAYAQFPPALEGVTVLDSHIEDGIRISYKEVRQPTCLRDFKTLTTARTIFVRRLMESEATPATFICLSALSLIWGYRTRRMRSIPSSGSSNRGKIQQMRLCRSGWYVLPRLNRDHQLSIFQNGGPGSSSMLGLLRENGPCYVNSDSNSTYLSDWSWNNEGMLATKDDLDRS